jgi:uridine kinase
MIEITIVDRVGTLEVNPADVILLEGILVLYPPAVRNMLNMKVYIDVDSDDRLARRGKFTTFSRCFS